jgi:hypothetical protein
MSCYHEEKTVSKGRFNNAIYYVASLLMPSILLLDLYNRNHARNLIFFTHVLILAGILAICGLMIFVAFKLITRSVEGALLLNLMSWLAFWLYEWLLGTIRSILSTIFLPSRVFALSLLVIVGFVAFFFNRFKPPFGKVRPAFNVLAFCVIVFFLFNLFPGVSSEVNFAIGRAEMARLEYDERPYYIKRSFQVDPSLPYPDIYWIHMDGLMSFETVERFWGLNYDDLREEIQARGFKIYENAEVNGGFTRATLPAIFSPSFYDSFWGEQLANTETMLNPERSHYLLSDVLNGVGLNDFEDIAPHFELLSAFFARGYELYVNTSYDYVPTSFEQLLEEQHHVSGFWERLQRSDLPRLLSMTTPLPMIYHEYTGDDTEGVTHLRHIEPVARFVFLENVDAHMGEGVQFRIMDSDRNHLPNYVRYDLYPSHGFEIAILNMLDEIDEILERNPNAVIVLQSDHGFHIVPMQQHLKELGYPLEQILELIYSVFSAVRIPDEYGGLDEPIAPLNITRELVNRFVGENYYLLLE